MNNQILMQNPQWEIFYNWWPNGRITIMTEIFEKFPIDFDNLWADLTNFSEKISKIFWKVVLNRGICLFSTVCKPY